MSRDDELELLVSEMAVGFSKKLEESPDGVSLSGGSWVFEFVIFYVLELAFGNPRKEKVRHT